MMAEALAPLLKEIRGCRVCIDAPEGAPLPHRPRKECRTADKTGNSRFPQR